jgi:hypothetical protein
MNNNRRYSKWAGTATREYMNYIEDLSKGNNPSDIKINALWPIVDDDTQVIDGFPRPEQCFCFCPTSEIQTLVCEALNAYDKSSK